MTQTAKAIKAFASGFGLPAYSTDTVPDDVSLPYITFPLTEPEWNQKATWYLQGWYETKSNTELFAKADDEIKDRVLQILRESERPAEHQDRRSRKVS